MIKAVLILLFALIVILAVLLTQGLKALSQRFNIFVDLPNERSSHAKAMPRCGGLAIVILFFVFFPILIRPASMPLLGYLLGAALISLVGMIDDLRGLKGGQKILGMVLSSLIPIVFGLKLGFLGIVQDNPLMLYLLSVVWIYGMINAFNFMDGIDGLIGGTSIIFLFFIAGLALISHNAPVFLAALVLLPACAGFLLFNLSPASVFLGDVGSMFLGYNFAVLTIMLTNQSLGRLPIYFAVILLAPVIYDSMATFVKRGLERKDLIAAHREHLYQRLVLTGRSHRDVSLIYYLLSLFCGSCALLFLLSPTAWKAAIAVLVLAVFLGFSRAIQLAESSANGAGKNT